MKRRVTTHHKRICFNRCLKHVHTIHMDRWKITEMERFNIKYIVYDRKSICTNRQTNKRHGNKSYFNDLIDNGDLCPKVERVMRLNLSRLFHLITTFIQITPICIMIFAACVLRGQKDQSGFISLGVELIFWRKFKTD